MEGYAMTTRGQQLKRVERLGMVEAQKAANAFVRDYISKQSLGLPDDLTEGQFEAVMNAITRGMIQAWGDGHYTGAK